MTDLTEHTDARRHQFAADPYRPLYHFVAPANFMGDPNGTIFWKGKYHLFSRGGTTTARAMDAWQMAPVWPTGKTGES
ncbi:MAG: hypothetical protein QGG69_05225 [Kiritimatiellia bacterium]|jgi:sucrose-6-phosphate hydrolase SacC (GH32 family)|nr:hypothetical protein [Kiritimatiellia bacterium]